MSLNMNTSLLCFKILIIDESQRFGLGIGDTNSVFTAEARLQRALVFIALNEVISRFRRSRQIYDF